MKNVPPSVRSALKRRGADAILQQEGDYVDFKQQIEKLIHGDEVPQQRIVQEDYDEEYQEDISPEEKKVDKAVEGYAEKYGNPDEEESFDEDFDDYEDILNDMRVDGVNISDDSEVLEYLGANLGLDKEDQEAFIKQLHEENAKIDEDNLDEYVKYFEDAGYEHDEAVKKAKFKLENDQLLKKLENMPNGNKNDIPEELDNKKKYDWKAYDNKTDFTKGGYLADNEDYNLATKHATFGPKYKGGHWGHDGWQSYGYDTNQWQGTYGDNIGTESESPWFKTKEEAQKWAEERYEKGITQITPERIEELAQKYGQSEDITTPSSYDGSPYKTGRIIHTGLTSKEDLEVLQSVMGQLSDGLWENSRTAEKFWKNLDIYRNDDGEIVIRTKEGWNSPYRDKTPQDVMKYLAQKAKQVVKAEIDDGAHTQWDRNSDYEMSYMGDSKTPIKISDVYKTYDRLLGRKQKQPKQAQSKQEPLDNKEADFPTGKRKLRDFAQMILKTPEIRDLGAEMIAWKYGISEADAEKYLSDIEKKFPVEFGKGK